jgi:hypothetical protein
VDKFSSRGLEFKKKPKGEEAKGEKEPKGGEKAEPKGKGKKSKKPIREIHLRKIGGGFIAKHLPGQDSAGLGGAEPSEHFIPSEKGDLSGLHAHMDEHAGAMQELGTQEPGMPGA